MDDRQPCGHRLDLGGQRQREEIAADREQQIMLLQDGPDSRRQARHGAAEQRMRGREAGGVGDALGIHRGAEHLGELRQLGVGAALRHGIAGDDHRARRHGEQLRRGLERGTVAAQARRHPRRRAEIDVGLGVEHIGGQRQEHRAGGRRKRGLGGAVDGARQILDSAHFGRPFDERPRDGRQVGPQDGLAEIEALIVLPGGEQDGRRRLLRVVQHAQRVAEPRRDMDIGDGEPARGLRIAVGHRHHRRLLEPEHVAQAGLHGERIHQRQLGGAGIAEENFDSLLLEQGEEGALSRHHGHASSLPSARFCTILAAPRRVIQQAFSALPMRHCPPRGERAGSALGGTLGLAAEHPGASDPTPGRGFAATAKRMKRVKG